MMPKRLLVIGLFIAAGCSAPESNGEPCNDCEEPNSTVGGDTGSNNPQPDMGSPPNNTFPGDCRVENNCTSAQVCNSSTGLCVECVTDNECGPNAACDPTDNTCSCSTGFHECDGDCVDNTSIQNCGTSCDPCPMDANGTATCDGSVCGLECDEDYVLSDEGHMCLGCVDNTNCTLPSASACIAAACQPCEGAGDCAHIAGAPICDRGTCVECTVDDDSACGGNSCDPATGTCTQTPKGSVETCNPCVADSECGPDEGCVPMEFQGAPRDGGFCLPVQLGDGCPVPYSSVVNRTSLSGRTVDYCTLNESLQTCEALLDYKKGCGDASECGAPNLDDAECEPIEFEIPARCTLACEASDECPDQFYGCNLGGPFCGSF